ncbi:putative glutathione S-transferase [Heterostelium album PN500]|uniref:Putative glutathione S-transferase n=1 Tax=Heterostelium pallidum (strain ATCC 26659 / Pp 5 / PN500) TaxID=670386 RepID=D3BBY4_HETP5|nr:putative glutathione S-transferase [Heterostelium album PN500]EFA81167.1 putative glutathione S-transferase [Heterostelium album PN500]|eukprot:XP_020433285.1 putative glutathione S-transferase [Heterostelium album PN500]
MTKIPTLYYFNSRGRGEGTRLLLTLAGVKFNDVRYNSALTPEIRSKTTYGTLPFYEDDDIQLAQSLAIESYLAGKFGLAGESPIERAKILSVSQAAIDFVLPIFHSDTDEKKNRFKNDTLPRLLNSYERLLIDNRNTTNEGKYIVGNKLSWADVSVFYVVDFLLFKGFGELVNQYPALNFAKSSFESIPVINDYLQQRAQNNN